MVKKSRHQISVEGNSLVKSFVDFGDSTPYTGVSTVRDSEGFKRELQGYDFLREYFVVPRRIGWDPESLTIRYEHLRDHQNLDDLVEQVVRLNDAQQTGHSLDPRSKEILSRKRTYLSRVFKGIGEKLREVHDATFRENGGSYLVTMVEDFADNNFLVPKDETQNVILIDQESFGEMEVQKNIVGFPTSALVTAFRSQNPQQGFDYLRDPLANFFKGYFRSPTPWPVELAKLSQEAYLYALCMLPRQHGTVQNAAMISKYVVDLASRATSTIK